MKTHVRVVKGVGKLNCVTSANGERFLLLGDCLRAVEVLLNSYDSLRGYENFRVRVRDTVDQTLAHRRI